MDPVHVQRIMSNLKTLIDDTRYNELIRVIERFDNKNEVIPERLMTKFKERPGYGWSEKQLNTEFYTEIQRRGPGAYQLLINCLKDSGHTDLAHNLDPSLNTQEDEESEIEDQNVEFYSDEGKHFVYLDNNWVGGCCAADREALRESFKDWGYQEMENDLKGAGSLLVINFCAFPNCGVTREDDWIYNTFTDHVLDGKPKILLSLRYTGTNSQDRVETDSGVFLKMFRDILRVHICLDTSKRGTSMGVSAEVQHLINVLAADDSLHIKEKLLKLQRKFTLHVQDSGFDKRFRLKKPNQIQ